MGVLCSANVPRRAHTAAVLALVVAAIAPATAGASTPSANPAGAVRISDERTITRWAHTADLQPVFSRPSGQAHRIARLRLLTEDKLPEVYLVLARWKNDAGNTWLKIRVPMRPNGRTGWVREDALGTLNVVHTRLVVNRHTLRVTLYDRGKKRFSARIGVGKASTPTPAGHFWIRELLRVPGRTFYGPYAFGTSAYSILTDWPGGGVVGIHGTNEPSLIPGRPSHGCVRMRNPDIVYLARHLPVGAPVRIS
jgi:hypothetical protein